jgi:hypothetical protein
MTKGTWEGNAPMPRKRVSFSKINRVIINNSAKAESKRLMLEGKTDGKIVDELTKRKMKISFSSLGVYRHEFYQDKEFKKKYLELKKQRGQNRGAPVLAALLTFKDALTFKDGLLRLVNVVENKKYGAKLEDVYREALEKLNLKYEDHTENYPRIQDSHTPDFIFYYRGKCIGVEVKRFNVENDVYWIKTMGPSLVMQQIVDHFSTRQYDMKVCVGTLPKYRISLEGRRLLKANNILYQRVDFFPDYNDSGLELCVGLIKNLMALVRIELTRRGL